MKLSEEFLLEVTFENRFNLERHYADHVLRPNERFNPENPKFSYMSIEEYARRAEELSNADAGKSDSRENIVGFITERNGIERIIKYKKYSSRRGFGEEVIYVDDEEKGHEIITYMMTRPGKLYRERKNFKRELPENVTNED